MNNKLNKLVSSVMNSEKMLEYDKKHKYSIKLKMIFIISKTGRKLIKLILVIKKVSKNLIPSIVQILAMTSFV